MSRKQKKPAPPKCSTTENLTAADTRPEDEEMEKAAAAEYGIDIEGDRRLDAEYWERRRKLRDRYHGALLGLAAGDALGTTLEFRSPGGYHRSRVRPIGGQFLRCRGNPTGLAGKAGHA